LLAKNVNDNACLLNERGAFESFASKLAPTLACAAFFSDTSYAPARASLL
jgi:hypothetical protein